MKVAIGIAIVALHAVLFVLVIERVRGTEFTVDVRSPLASPALSLDGTVPAAIAPRVTSTVEQTAPGLARKTWSVRYRGGYARSIGASQLVGPFQDPAARACSGRVVVSQRLLDAFAVPVEKQLELELSGEGFVGIGDFVQMRGLKMRWAQLAAHPEDK